MLLEMLLRLLCDITYEEETAGGELDEKERRVVNLIEVCLTLVVKICPEQTKVLCADIKSRTSFNQTFAAVIERVFE
jgi:hypothetical protein